MVKDYDLFPIYKVGICRKVEAGLVTFSRFMAVP